MLDTLKSINSNLSRIATALERGSEILVLPGESVNKEVASEGEKGKKSSQKADK